MASPIEPWKKRRRPHQEAVEEKIGTIGEPSTPTGSVRKKCVSLQGSYLWSLKNKIENKNCFYEAYTGTNIGNDF